MNEKPVRKPRNVKVEPEVLHRARVEALCSKKSLGEWLEDAVYKMTGLPCEQIGITDRGKIEVGLAGDITVFDPDTVKDNATYAEPLQYSEGILYVIVNGGVVIDDGEHTGALPGKILRLNEMGE